MTIRKKQQRCFMCRKYAFWKAVGKEGYIVEKSYYCDADKKYQEERNSKYWMRFERMRK